MASGRRLLLVLVAALGVLWLSAAPAVAHNVLTDSAPTDGEEVARGPDEVELRFLASLDPDNADLSVTGPDGGAVVAGDPVFDGASVTIPVDTALAGDYQVSYEVLSADGHWVDGTIEFTVTEGEPVASPTPEPTTPAAPPATGEPTPDPAATAGDDAGGLPWWAWLAIALVAAGGAAGGLLLHRRRSRRSLGRS